MDESYRHTDDNRTEFVPKGGTSGVDRIACLAHRQEIFRTMCNGSDLRYRMDRDKR